MESQFILRLPNSLKEINLSEASFTKINDTQASLEYKGRIYSGIIYKSPTIIDSHKVVDGKLYKVSDISTIVTIYECDSFDPQYEVEVSQLSGISPPMKLVKERRFKNNKIKMEMVEEIERKVSQLLEKDSMAIKVEFNTQESEELDLMAAEMEQLLVNDDQNDIFIDQKNIQSVSVKEKLDEKVNEKLIEFKKKIEEKEELLKKTTNPILKRRFERQIEDLKNEMENIQK